MVAYGAAARKPEKHGKVTYPPDHKLGMHVPVGGSDCAKCKFVDGQDCTNKIFVRWNGDAKIPALTNEYCCDMFETKEKS